MARATSLHDEGYRFESYRWYQALLVQQIEYLASTQMMWVQILHGVPSLLRSVAEQLALNQPT